MKITNKEELGAAILELEQVQETQKLALSGQLLVVKESLKPLNLIKGVIKKFGAVPQFSGGIINSVAGIAMGVLSKKIFLGKSPGIFKKLVSELLELLVAKTAISNAEKIKAYGKAIYNVLSRPNKKDNAEPEFPAPHQN